MNEYWNNEIPVEFDTGKNVLRYFKQAGKLQICMPYWTDNHGEQKPGKTVTLDVFALIANEAACEMIVNAISNPGS